MRELKLARPLVKRGMRFISIDLNPATIATDPKMADRTYIEPITLELMEQVLQKEKPDALLPTTGE